VVQVRVYQESPAYASSVLQPIIAFYSLAVIFFMFWLASWWAAHKDQNGHPRGYRFWHTLSNASFGVYLIHAILLAVILQRIVPVMPSVWPVAIRVFLVWFLTAGSSTVITLILLNIPVLSRLVGREHSAQKKAIQPARENKPEKQLQPVAAMAIRNDDNGKDAFPRSVIEPGPVLSEMQRT
jgi:probable poly-beta-1,6-N-acetyl-D-glucosamine export protein